MRLLTNVILKYTTGTITDESTGTGIHLVQKRLQVTEVRKCVHGICNINFIAVLSKRKDQEQDLSVSGFGTLPQRTYFSIFFLQMAFQTRLHTLFYMYNVQPVNHFQFCSYLTGLYRLYSLLLLNINSQKSLDASGFWYRFVL
jgi:hypothetical protein